MFKKADPKSQRFTGGPISSPVAGLPGIPGWLRGLALLLLALVPVWPEEPEPIQLFPLDGYHRLADPWLLPGDDSPLFTPVFQEKKAGEFRKAHLAPWESDFAATHLTQGVLTLEARVMGNLEKDIERKEGLGSNHRPYDGAWLRKIGNRLAPGTAVANPRAITVENALVRLLPTADLYMHSHRRPGQGYPFDQLQNSVIWAGTPVYVVQQTVDHAWCKVLAPDCSGWVRAQALANVGDSFARRWRRAVEREGLAAVIATEAAVKDARGRFRFQAYVGSVHPRCQGPELGSPGRMGILIPDRDSAGRATLTRAYVEEGCAVPQPWAYTPGHAATLWKALLGRPYGWGNLNFHNDCSAEMKAFFTPFGLWLPRHSSSQKEVGLTRDLSALGMAERIRGLHELGKPYRSLVWIEGHVMLYLGPMDFRAENGDTAAGFMTYQNLWALRPQSPPDFRRIVGGSMLFPVLDHYPGQPELHSLAQKKHFVITQLDEDPVP